MKKRIFIGCFVKIPGFSDRYREIKREFDRSIQGRWIPEENFHITLRFIGQVDGKGLEQIKTALSGITNRKVPVELSFEGLGAFPNPYRPKVFFIKVRDGSGEIYRLKREVDRRLALLGYPEEDRPFVPHITLKRIKSSRPQLFNGQVEKYKKTLFGTEGQVEVNIIESLLTPEGAIYKKLE
ncbi:MAG: RNA 2',3'-cyclic phosphodiesterase [Aquificae bacterium]|nr:RNA 2',3'-cyclic phosphodiesterase [Aquificota bacterium]